MIRLINKINFFETQNIKKIRCLFLLKLRELT